MHPLGHLHEIVGDAQAAQEEGLAAEVVLDGAADPVVADLRARTRSSAMRRRRRKKVSPRKWYSTVRRTQS